MFTVSERLDEVFGAENFVNSIVLQKKSATSVTESVYDEIICISKNKRELKIKPLFDKRADPEGESKFNTIFRRTGEPVNVSKHRKKTLRLSFRMVADGRA